MTVLRFCEFCQQRTAHHDLHTTGITWVGSTLHELPEGYNEIYCSRCKAVTMEYLEPDE